MTFTDTQKLDQYYQALVDRDPEYLGVFYVGVKTTSVFCISTCRARKPLRQNVEFFPSFRDAMENGYRPCKICRPTEHAHEAPEEVQRAIDLVRDHPKRKIDDQELREAMISPDQVRRWFKKNYGITYHAFQRMYRINQAYEELQKGKDATSTAFGAGYESLSGFGYTYKKLLGKSPQKADDQSVILISRLTTPIGPMLVCATSEGICLLEFTMRKMLETEFEDLQKRLKAPILTGENAHIIQLKRELEEYFKGERQVFEVALHQVGTDFQQLVWDELLRIPYGTTTSYQKQAKAMGRDTAVRAIASANGCNKIAIVIPCHRVIGSDGSLTGYAGGLERKQWLLDFERGVAEKN